MPIPKNADPQLLFEQACGAKSPGAASALAKETIKGSVWLKAHSKEASGQFPALVEVSPSGTVQMEVTNLVGGVEAIIRVEGNRYSIEMPKEKPEYRKQQGSASWGGIPLHWASRLFQGRVPCPPPAALAEMALTLGSEGELKVDTKPSLEREAEVFNYRFRMVKGSPWPESLHWERKGVAPVMVDFKFDDPEDKSGSPRKWEAQSPMGEVKVRWRERETRP